MSGKTPAKMYKFNLEKRGILIIILFFLLINLVVFTAGYLLRLTFESKESGKLKILKNDNSITYMPVNPDSAIIAAKISNDIKGKEDDSVLPATDQTKIIDKRIERPEQHQTTEKPKPKLQKKQNSTKPAKLQVPQKTNFFTIEVYSYKNQIEAENFKDILAKRNCPAFISDEKTGGGQTAYKVRIGKYKTRIDANAEGKKLENRGIIPRFYIKKILSE